MKYSRRDIIVRDYKKISEGLAYASLILMVFGSIFVLGIFMLLLTYILNDNFNMSEFASVASICLSVAFLFYIVPLIYLFQKIKLIHREKDALVFGREYIGTLKEMRHQNSSSNYPVYRIIYTYVDMAGNTVTKETARTYNSNKTYNFFKHNQTFLVISKDDINLLLKLK